jgi:hypothetical protein
MFKKLASALAIGLIATLFTYFITSKTVPPANIVNVRGNSNNSIHTECVSPGPQNGHGFPLNVTKYYDNCGTVASRTDFSYLLLDFICWFIAGLIVIWGWDISSQKIVRKKT